MVVENPSFDLLNLYQDLFKQLRSIILSGTENLNNKIDRAEELHSDLSGCITNRSDQLVSFLDLLVDFCEIIYHRLTRFRHSNSLRLYITYAIQNKNYMPIEGFHPGSILYDFGRLPLKNYSSNKLKLVSIKLALF